MISDGENTDRASRVLALIDVGISLGKRFLASDAMSETPQADVVKITSEAREMVLDFDLKTGFII